MDPITWSHRYSYSQDERRRKRRIGPFQFITESTITDSRPNALKIMFEVGVWLDGSIDEDVEPLLRKIGMSAETVDGIVGVNGDYRKWHSEKLDGEERVQKGERTKLFVLRTVKPVKPVRSKQGQDSFELDLEVRFKLGGTSQEQIALLVDTAFPEPTPPPGSAYGDSVSLVSQPPNLALRINASGSDRHQHVWVQEEKLAAASPYLSKLVNALFESEDSLVARRSLDGRTDFDAVDDDSDDEEDTGRYKLVREREKSDDELERGRSEAPPPADEKQRIGDMTASQAMTVSKRSIV